MNQERVEVGKAPHITIVECTGDLVVRTWAETAVLIKGDEVVSTESDDGLSITGQSSLKLTCPVNSSLTINTVHGDALIKSLDGGISLRAALGDVKLLKVGMAKFGDVHGDLVAKNIDGDLSAETIHGDVIIRTCDALAVGTIHGDLSAQNVGGTADLVSVMGDISLRDISGDVTVKQGSGDANLRELNGDTNTLSDISGDIRLRGPLNPGEHTFRATGDIVMRWPLAADISLTAVASQIVNRIDMDDVDETGDILTGRIGDGSAAVSLTANGRIALKESKLTDEKWSTSDDMDFDFNFNPALEELGDLINAKVFEQANRISSDLESKFGPEFSEKITHQAEKAMRQVERAAEKAMRQVERSVKGNWHRRPPKPPRAPKAAAKPSHKASGEEQLKILKMVEKGIISPDEAGTLLEALES